MSTYGANKLTARQVREAERLRVEGQSIASIARRFGVTPPVIRYHVGHIDPEAPPRQPWDRLDDEAILLMLGLGHRPSEIARHFGVNSGTIANALKRMEWRAGE